MLGSAAVKGFLPSRLPLPNLGEPEPYTLTGLHPIKPAFLLPYIDRSKTYPTILSHFQRSEQIIIGIRDNNRSHPGNSVLSELLIELSYSRRI